MNNSAGTSKNPYRTDTSLPCFALGLDQSPKLAMLYSLFKVVQPPTQHTTEEEEDHDTSGGGGSFMVTSHTPQDEEVKQAVQDEEAKKEEDANAEEDEDDDMEFTCLKKLSAGERLQLKNSTNTAATR